jgi:hypothetical protein
MRRDAILVLAARGLGFAFGAWKALLLALALNALLAAALTRPVASAIHAVTDASPVAARLLASEIATFWDHVHRAHPAVFGDVAALDDFATGGEVKKSLFSWEGAAGSLVWMAIASALLASLLAGGFAGRFGADRDRASLASFGSDAGRFAFSSLVLGFLSLAGIVAAYWYLYAWPGTLYDADDLRYEWEAVAILLGRLLAFLLAAAIVRLLVLYARAEIGLSRKGNPFRALGFAAGFLSRRPARASALELLFGALSVAPLLLWALFAPVWNGSDPLSLALVVAAQQLLVVWRIAARVGHLGAASAFVRRVRETVETKPAPVRPAPVDEGTTLVPGPAA